MDRDLLLPSESGETLSYLGTRSRATRSAEETQIEKITGKESVVGRREIGGKKASTARRQLRRTPQHVRVYVLSFSLGKILSYKSTPTEKLLARERSSHRAVDRPTFV